MPAPFSHRYLALTSPAPSSETSSSSLVVPYQPLPLPDPPLSVSLQSLVARIYNQGPLGSCFPAGTPITLADGSLCPIEHIRIRDAVKDHTGAPVIVSGCYQRTYSGPAAILTFTDGTTIQCTATHPFLSEGDWIAAADLLPHQPVTTPNRDTPLLVASVTTTTVTDWPVYNLETFPTHTYLVAGIAVHNCTAFASLSWFNLIRRLEGHRWQDFSQLAQYWAERSHEHTVSFDSGATTRDALWVLETEGPMLERYDPYNPAAFRNPPPPDWEPALKLHPQQAQYLPATTSLEKIQLAKNALARRYPLLFGFVAYPELEGPLVAQTGGLPLPTSAESPIGGHEVVAVGYHDRVQFPYWRNPGAFLILNSWGLWGLRGYFWMPYEYFGQYTDGLIVAGVPLMNSAT